MRDDIEVAAKQVWRSRDPRDDGRSVRVVQIHRHSLSFSYVEVVNVVTGRNTAIRDDVFRRRYEYVEEP